MQRAFPERVFRWPVSGSPRARSPSATVPFAFTGKLEKLSFTVERPKLSPDDEKKLVDAMRAASDAK
jgi:hypothetical protein